MGSEAPDFELEDQDGRKHRLSGYRGRWVVLYFYPRDDTSGCTKEACAFRDALPAFTDENAVVLGMSADDRASHERFARKHALTFPLLVDPDKQVLQEYGAYGERSRYGRTFMGVKRITYLIDPRGKIARAWSKVDAAEHPAEVRQALASLVA